MNELVAKAFDIACNDLKSCYLEHGIVGGLTRLKDYHARNSFFASFGSIALEDFDIVKKNICFFLSLQRNDGMIPVMVSKKLKPFYSFWFFNEPVDHNALLVIAFSDIAAKANDSLFIEKNFDGIFLAVKFLEKKEKMGLIEEGLGGNWAHSVLKNGFVLYTNCCYFKALKGFSTVCRLTGREALAEKYSEKAVAVKEKINKMFWAGTYYADWIDFKRHENFSSDGNVLSILWGIADDEQSKMIENNIRQYRLNTVPLKTCHPLYPFWRIMWFLLPLQAYHYHNGSSWTWLGALNVLALKRLGWNQEARDEIRAIARTITENGTVIDVLDNGKPFSSLLLKSEIHFSWGAGLFVKAVKELYKEKTMVDDD